LWTCTINLYILLLTNQDLRGILVLYSISYSKDMLSSQPSLPDNNTAKNSVHNELKTPSVFTALASQTKAALLWLALLTPQNSQAQTPDSPQLLAEADIATNKSDGTFEDTQLNEKMNFAISDVFRFRQAGIEFYGEFLTQFEQLPKEDQYQVALAIDWENWQWGSDMTDEMLNLVREWRVPLGMIDSMKIEAESNWADTDPDWWEVPAFAEVLMDIRTTWMTESWDSYEEMLQFAPNTISKLYFVFATNLVQSKNEAAIAELEAVTAENEAARAENEAARAENEAARAENEAVDEYGNTLKQRLELQRRATQALKDAANTVSE